MNPELFLEDVLSAPDRLAVTLDSYAAADGPLSELSKGPAVERVVLIGMGSSRFAALSAATLLASRGVAVSVEYASTARPQPPARGTVAVGISASGETAETVAALERHANVSTTVALTNVPGSSIESVAEIVLPLLSGPEPGGVACVSFQSTLAVLLLLAQRLTPDVAPVDLRAAVDLSRELRARRSDWLDDLAALVGDGELTQATAPSHRISSALQSALMLREGPRLNASAAETGDWLHVDVYLTKRPGYRTLLFAGSDYDAGVIEWATSRNSPVIAVGRHVPGATLQVPIEAPSDEVAGLVEVGVTELVAAHLWIAQSG